MAPSLVRSYSAVLTAMFVSLAATSSRPAAQDDSVAVTGVTLRHHDGTTELQLEISSRLPDQQVELAAEVIAPDDTVVGSCARSATLDSPTQTVACPLPQIDQLDEDERLLLPWHRLRYRVVLAGRQTPRAEDLVTVANVAAEAITLAMTTSADLCRPGTSLPVWIAARYLVTGEPGIGVAVTVRLRDNAGEELAEQRVVTGGDGTALVELLVPSSLQDQNLEVVAETRNGPFLDRQEIDVWAAESYPLSLATDKPLYQPGQTVHFRGMARDQEDRALDGVPVTFTVRDEESRVLHEQRAVASRFGIAHGAWQIPETAELGSYDLTLEVAGEETDTSWKKLPEIETELAFRVSRYELPSVTATIEPDHPYYLPGQDAELAVSVTTLAGQPVAGATVELLPVEKEWISWLPDDEDENEVDDEEILWRGETGDDGSCRTRLDLREAHEEIAERSYERFRDLTYVVRVSDGVSGRSTLHRVTVRVTREPLHLYLNQDGTPPAGWPAEIWISSFSADGRPLSCRVELRSEEKQELLAEVETNRYGLALVSLASPPDQTEWGVVAEAVSGDGLRGTADLELIWSADAVDPISVRPVRVFHRPGEPIELELRSTVPEAELIIEVRLHQSTLSWQSVLLNDGRAICTVPYNERFSGQEVRVAAFYTPSTWIGLGDWEEINMGWVSGSSCTVVYPDQAGLALNLVTEPAEALPGETVTLMATAHDAAGRPAEAAVGLLVLDSALELLVAQRGEPSAISHFINTSRETLLAYTSEKSFGSVTRFDLLQVDAGEVSADLELVARLLLDWGDYGRWFSATDLAGRATSLYRSACEARVAGLQEQVDRFETMYDRHPTTLQELLPFLAKEGLLESLVDPWQRPFHLDLDVQGRWRRLQLTSSGADRQPGTRDDITVTASRWCWLEKEGWLRRRLQLASRRATGTWITEEGELLAAVEQHGVDWNELRDPWDNRLRLSVSVRGSKVVVSMDSPGPDHRFEENPFPLWRLDHRFETSCCPWLGDDARVARYEVETFEVPERKITDALVSWTREGRSFPADEESVHEVLQAAALTSGELADPRGEPYYFTVDEWTRYRDATRVEAGPQGQQTISTPILSVEYTITVRSTGDDRRRQTGDDVTVHSFTSSGIAATAAVPISVVNGLTLQVDETHGAVTGEVTLDGSPLPGATVTVTGNETSRTTVSDAAGRFAFLLPPGLYQMKASLTGFVPTTAVVQVDAATVSSVVLALAHTSEDQEIVVTSGSPPFDSTAALSIAGSASFESMFGRFGPEVISMLKDGEVDRSSQPHRRVPPAVRPLQTPRVRKEFPETLRWEPELVTGSDGRLALPVTLADAVTTWKVQAVASTVDGGLATAETTVVAALPFYLELDLPPILTRGDAIELPVLVRNYTADEQLVQVGLEAGDSLELRKRGATLRVDAGDAGRVTFPVVAVQPSEEESVRATGTSAEAGDALQRSLRIAPYGEEVRRSRAAVFRGEAEIPLAIPATAIPGTAAATVRVFPNLAAHLREGMQGLLQRPIGCGEQLTSAGWVALLLLDHLQGTGADPAAQDTELWRQGRDHVSVAVRRLSELTTGEGGFSFWRHGEADPLLTAYALRFLVRAAVHVEVDGPLVQDAASWLVSLQDQDGAWRRNRSAGGADAEKKPSERFMLQDSAFIARALAEVAAQQRRPDGPAGAAADRALDLLEPHLRSFDEPYTVASFALISAIRDRREQRDWARERLASLARHEGGAAFWQVHRNTPLFGWGLPGRLESTALAVLALHDPADAGDEYSRLCHDGLRYLLRHKDPNSAWYSTQATVVALQAMTSLGLAGGREGGELRLTVSGRTPIVLPLPDTGRAAAAINVELPQPPAGEGVTLQLQRSGGSAALTAELQLRYHLPWEERRPAVQEEGNLALRVDHDRTQAAIGDIVTCTVTAARIAERGDGMLLAEIGLPPGAEVDRHSLEQSLSWQESYELRPDRVILYLWTRPGGSTVTFSFKPRFAGDMVSAPSLLYDYYNPEERIVLPPSRFAIRER